MLLLLVLLFAITAFVLHPTLSKKFLGSRNHDSIEPMLVPSEGSSPTWDILLGSCGLG